MIFIKNYKINFVGIGFVIILIFSIILTGLSQNKIQKLNRTVCEKDRVITDKEIEIENLMCDIENWEAACKIKDDKIIELEGKLEEYERYKQINSMSIPNIGDKKTYMSYRMIKKNSNQGRIVYSDEAWTDQDGLRLWQEYYCVALGSYYGAVGDKFWVETDKGNKYKVIKADEKSDVHTDPSNKYTVATNCMMEWLVDIDKLNVNIKKSGNINNIDKVSGKIVKIVKIGE